MMVPNLLAVVVAAAANMALGALWYSPLLFAKPWMRLTGQNPNQMGNPAPGYAIAAVASLVSALVLADLVRSLSAGSVAGSTVSDGLIVGLLVGVGFVATAMGTDYAFHGRPAGLYLINAAYRVVGLVIMGAILAVWPR